MDRRAKLRIVLGSSIVVLGCSADGPSIGARLHGSTSADTSASRDGWELPLADDEGEVDPSSGRLTLATWNIAWLHPEDGRGPIPREAEDYERLARYAERLDADVIALQEVGGSVAAARIFDAARYDFHFPDDGRPQQVGFAYRPELDVVDRGFLDELDLGSLRPGVTLELRHGGYRFELLGVHLKSGCAEPDATGSTCDTLLAQAQILGDWVDQRTSQGIPFAILGDFNRRFVENGAIWQILDRRESEPVGLFDAGADRSSGCWAAHDARFLDHVVFDPTSAGWYDTSSFVEWRYRPWDHAHRDLLSDHCPLVTSLNAE